jgi:hypothetical protein
MKSNLAIATLIRSRMTELGLSRGELAAKRRGGVWKAKNNNIVSAKVSSAD